DIFMFTFYNKPSGLASITAVRKGTGMNGVYILHFSKFKIPAASVVHRVNFDSFFFVMTGNFKIANNYGSRIFSNFFSIERMILVCMGKKNKICFKIVYINFILDIVISCNKRIY